MLVFFLCKSLADSLAHRAEPKKAGFRGEQQHIGVEGVLGGWGLSPRLLMGGVLQSPKPETKMRR